MCSPCNEKVCNLIRQRDTSFITTLKKRGLFIYENLLFYCQLMLSGNNVFMFQTSFTYDINAILVRYKLIKLVSEPTMVDC